MTIEEASSHLTNNLPKHVCHTLPTLTVCHEDDIKTWGAKIKCLITGDVGEVYFDEHYGELFITWNVT